MISFYWIITILFFISSIHILIVSFEQVYLLIKSRKIDKQQFIKAKLSDDLPFVTVQLPIYNEGHVIENLLRNALLLNYPRDRFEIQILDDSTDETTELIANFLKENTPSGLTITHIRRKDRQGFKAGNLKNGFQYANGEYIAVFDADFIIPQDFLLQTIKTFEQKNIAAVQTRWGHLNESYSFLTKIQGMLLNNHFLNEKLGRNNAGWMVQFNGTAGIWRKEAIEDAGGWQSDTLIEDVDLSIRAQLKGWEICIRPDIVCPAELPNEINGLKLQQFRWMQGSAEVTRKHLVSLWKSNFSIAKKYHGTLHLATGYLFLSIFIMSISSVPMIFVVPALHINLALLGILSFPIVFNAVPLFVVNYYHAWKNESKKIRISRFAANFPILILLSMGLAFHNTIAIIKGTFGLYTPFKRTPKLNNYNNGNQVENKNDYRILTGKITLFEFILILYFLLGAFLGFYAGNLIFVGFHFILALSYFIVAGYSSGILRTNRFERNNSNY